MTIELIATTDDAGGCCWQACAGGICCRDRDRATALQRLRDALVISHQPGSGRFTEADPPTAPCRSSAPSLR